MFSAFIEIFNSNAKKINLQNIINGIVGSMEILSFPKEEFDLIWSEGAIDNIGFEKVVSYWSGFLKKGGYIAVTKEMDELYESVKIDTKIEILP